MLLNCTILAEHYERILSILFLKIFSGACFYGNYFIRACLINGFGRVIHMHAMLYRGADLSPKLSTACARRVRVKLKA
jgi:hypothetical protein